MTPCACQKESATCEPDTFPISVRISFSLVSLLGEQFLGQPEGVAPVLREQLSIPRKEWQFGDACMCDFELDVKRFRTP